MPRWHLALFCTLLLLPALCETQGAVERARLSIESEDYVTAERILRAHVRQQPKDSLALYLLGVTLSQTERYAASDEYLRSALQLNSKLPLAHRFLGLNAFETGNYRNAQQYLTRYLKIEPQDEVAYLILARLSLAQQKYAEAVQYFSRADSLLREDPSLRLLSARALAGAGRDAEARKIVEELPQDTPDIQMESAALLAEIGDPADAVAMLEKLHRQHPETSSIQYNLALAYLKAGQCGLAASLLERRSTTDQADSDVLRLLGDSYRCQGQHEKAMASLETAIRLFPNEPRAYIDLAALQTELEKIPSGLATLKAGIQRFPNRWEFPALQGALFSLSHEFGPAEASYRRALQLSPGNESAYIGMAALFAFEDNRLEEARRLLEPRLSQFRGSYAKYLYADVMRRLGLDSQEPARSRVRQMLEDSVKLSPGFAPARLQLGRMYAAAGMLEQAQKEFEAAASADPGDKASHYELYRLYQGQGNSEKAAQMLAAVKQIVEREGGNTPSSNIRARVSAVKLAADGVRRR